MFQHRRSLGIPISRNRPAAEAAKYSATGAFLLMLAVYHTDGRAESTASSGNVSVSSEAKVVITNRIELRQSGDIVHVAHPRSDSIQVNSHECDPELRRLRKECVLLIYEIQ